MSEHSTSKDAQVAAAKASAAQSKGALPLGLDVAILWRGDMLTARFFSKPQRITVGPRGTFVLPSEVLGTDLQVLVEPHGAAKFGLRVDNAQAQGHLIVEGDVHELAEVREGKVTGLSGPVIALSEGTRAVMVFGDFTFIVSREPIPPPTTFSLWSKEMIPFVTALLVAVLITIGPLVAAFNSPEYLRRASMTFQELKEERMSELLLIEVKEEPPPEEEKEEEKKKEPPKAPELKPEKKPDPKAVEKRKEAEQVKKEEKEIDEKLDSVTDEAERKDVIKKLVAAKADEATAEIDAVLEKVNNQEIGTKLFAESDDPDSGDTANTAKPAGGAEVLADPTGKTQGALLMGASKKGTISKTTGTKRLVAKGLEKDSKTGKDVKIGMKTRKQRIVRVGSAGGSKASGELPRTIIQKVIRRKMGGIRACYQKGLQSNPNLRGKVVVKFLIAPSGQVSNAKVSNSSLNSPTVESCIQSNVRAWRFPRADGGGSTVVTYPFRFSAS